jgi:hypothetical protein
MKPLVLSNFDPLADELIYSNDIGSWNVTRALRDCNAGKHKLWLIDVAETYKANAGVEVDDAKVERFMLMPEVFEQSSLLAIVENGKLWLIDGHHRLRALYRLGILEFDSFIIEESDAASYQVRYNGKRKPPFKLY